MVIALPGGTLPGDEEAVEEPEEDDEGPTGIDPGFKQLFFTKAGGTGLPLVCGGCWAGRFFRAMILGGFRRDKPELLPPPPLSPILMLVLRKSRIPLLHFFFSVLPRRVHSHPQQCYRRLAVNMCMPVGWHVHVGVGVGGGAR